MDKLISQLSQQLGVHADKIEAGVGALLGAVKEKLPADEFQKLVDKVPGAQGWIDKAAALPSQARETGNGLLGQAAGLLGSLSGNAQGGLAGILEKLEAAGFKADSAAQLVPAVVEQIKSRISTEQFEKLLDAVPALKTSLGGVVGGLLGKFGK